MKIAAYCGTRGIYEDMEAAAKSLVANSDVDKVYMVIEDDDMGRDLPDIVECINVSDQTFFKPDGPNMQSKFTYMAMMRIALCYVLPQDVDRVLSLDHDTIAVGIASPVWDLPIDDYYLAVTPEWHRSKNGLMYGNFGVVLYNLDRMREGKADECIDVLNRRNYTWVEQDVGNYLCQGRMYEMPAKFNDNYWTTKGHCPNSVIKHYAGEPADKWRARDLPCRWRSTPWSEVLRLHEKR